MAQRLNYLAVGGPPLEICKLSSATPQRYDGPRSAAQPAIIFASVGQLGSRVLFRGFGVDTPLLSLHAGLLGADCMILLDELHQGSTILRTLNCIAQINCQHQLARAQAPWGHVQLRRETKSADIGRSDDDQPNISAYRAGKRAWLVTAQASARAIADHGAELADHAWRLARLDENPPAPRRVLIFVNHYALARACHTALYPRIAAAGPAAELILAFGRARGLEREAVEARLRMQLTNQASGDRTVFVVGTQALEASDEIDCDALVSQIAPLEVLRRRFACLNRGGVAQAHEGVIVACTDEVNADRECDFYKNSATTWRWLNRNANYRYPDRLGINFDEHLLNRRLGTWDADVAQAHRCEAPTDPLACLEFLSDKTFLPKSPSDVALLTYGRAEVGDVQVIWRANIDAADLQDAAGVERVHTQLKLFPPLPGEAMTLPLQVVTAWLAERTVPMFGDIEGAGAVANYAGMRFDACSSGGRRVVRWSRPNNASITSSDVRAGDVLIVPASYGGCDEYGWNPASRAPVKDLLPLAFQRSRGNTNALIGKHTDPLPLGCAAALVARVSDEARAAGLSHEVAQELCRAAQLLAQNVPDGPVLFHVHPQMQERILLLTQKNGDRCGLAARESPSAKRIMHVLAQYQEQHISDLTMWLVGTQYGERSLPFFFRDPSSSGPMREDFRIVGRPWWLFTSNLSLRIGCWQLARVESFLRLAIHQVLHDERN